MTDRRRLISLARLNEYVKAACKQPDMDSASTVQDRLGNVLWPKRLDGRRTFNRLIKRGHPLRLSPATLQELLRAIHGNRRVADEDKVIASWAPLPETVLHLPLGKASEGEIEVLGEYSTDNLVPGNRYVQVFIDKVRFWKTWDDAGAPVAGEGTYLRIETPGRQDGAVVLPVDRKTGDVCLVTQFRHPMRTLLTEVPRGFADFGIDDDAIATAHRELDEEANLEARELLLLKRSYTDTGKLADRPSLFLAMVDRSKQDARYRSKKPLMLDPVWVPLLEFYRAVYSDSDHLIDPSRLQFVHVGDHQKARLAKSELVEGKLAIEDGFTIQAALLALPRLKRQFGPLFAAEAGPWS